MTPPVPTVSKFLLPLKLAYPEDGHTWTLIGDFTYGSVTLERVITVPSGFPTDFASIPRPLWSLWPPTGPAYGKAAVLHDLLYRTPSEVCTRAQADGVLLEAMTDLGVGWWTRKLIYAGVRVGGMHAFKARTP